MTDKTDSGKPKTLTLSSSTLQLKTPVKGPQQVQQNFARGRSKTVTVEVKRRFNMASDAGKSGQGAADAAEQDMSGLTSDERSSRLRALQQAAEQQEQDRQAAEAARIEAEKRAAEEAKRRAEMPEPEAVEEAPAVAETVAAKPKVEAPAAEKPATPVVKERGDKKFTDEEEEAERKGRGPVRGTPEKSRDERGAPSKTKHDAGNSGRHKLTIASASSDQEERMRSLASIKRARAKMKRKEMGDNGEREKQSREIIVPEVITVQELANRMAERGVVVMKELMKLGVLAAVNQTIDADTAELVANELGHKVKRVTEADVENVLVEGGDTDEELESRVPVVTVMGHVDHGKTSLLDAIRSTDVTSGEAGGITQHIGAYQVTLDSGQKVTFLDTPGHEAFTAMRARGAKVTDIVVLVVAADDGIMPQTIEAINHAKAAEVPIIVAINKIDKPDADPSRVMNELLSHNLVTEEFGGDVMAIPVSALKRTNLDKLLETILLQSEVLELRANPNRIASGTVIESKIDRGRGVVSTFLVQRGTLHVGDLVIADTAYGRVRALLDDKGGVLEAAGPSVPVEVLGLDESPDAGAQFSVVETERQAREITEYRKKRSLDMKVAAEKRGSSLEQLFSKAAEGGLKELPVIIKADVQGSAEAIMGSLQKLATEEVKVRVIHSAVGGITESDVSLANASGAIIIGFNVRAITQARDLAVREKVDIRYYSIIYNLVDDMKAMLGGLLSPIRREQYLGSAVIRQVFNITKSGKVGGCYVTDGIIKRGAGVRLLRDSIVIHEGKLKTLKRFKDDVKEVKENFECGMAFENYEDIRENDVIEAFEVIEEKREL